MITKNDKIKGNQIYTIGIQNLFHPTGEYSGGIFQAYFTILLICIIQILKTGYCLPVLMVILFKAVCYREIPSNKTIKIQFLEIIYLVIVVVEKSMYMFLGDCGTPCSVVSIAELTGKHFILVSERVLHVSIIPYHHHQFWIFQDSPEFTPHLLLIGKLSINIGAPNKNLFLDGMSYLSVLLPRYTSLVFEG